MPEQSINEQTRQMMGMPTSGDPAIIDPTTGRPYTADASMRQQEEITRQAEVKEEFASEQRLQLPKDLEEEIEEEIRPKARPEGLPNIYEKKTAIDKTLEYGYLLKERQPGAKGKTKIVTGLDERNPAHQKIIKAFFDSAVGGDTGFDPTKQAWCAAFVNHILTEMGADLIESKDPYKRLRANEYKTYGKPVDLENIQEGDIVVFDFDKDGTADHVTFYAGGRITSQGEGQYINVIGGNQGGGEVSIRENEPGYTLDNVAAIRRVTYDGDAYEIAQSHKDSDPVFKTFLPEEHEDYALNLQGNYNEGGDVAAQMNSMLPSADDDTRSTKEFLQHPLETVPYFQRPMGSSTDDPQVGQDDAGNPVFKGSLGEYTVRVNPDQRTLRTKVEEAIPVVKEAVGDYLENPKLPTKDQLSEFAKQAGQSAVESVKDLGDLMFKGKGTLGDVVGLAVGAGTGSIPFSVPEGALRTFGGATPPTYQKRETPLSSPLLSKNLMATETYPNTARLLQQELGDNFTAIPDEVLDIYNMGLLIFREPIVEFAETLDIPKKGLLGSEFLNRVKKNPSIPETSLQESVIEPSRRYSKDELLRALGVNANTQGTFRSVANISPARIKQFERYQRQGKDAGFVGGTEIDYFDIPIDVTIGYPGKKFKAHSQHYQDETLVHVRGSILNSNPLPDRDLVAFDTIIDDDNFLLVEEIQSDLLTKGYVKPKSPFDAAFSEAIDEYNFENPVKYQEAYGDISTDIQKIFKELDEEGIYSPELPIQLEPFSSNPFFSPETETAFTNKILDKGYTTFEELKDYIKSQNTNSDEIWGILSRLERKVPGVSVVNDAPGGKTYTNISLDLDDPTFENFLDTFYESVKGSEIDHDILMHKYEDFIDNYNEVLLKKIKEKGLSKELDLNDLQRLREKYEGAGSKGTLSVGLPPIRKNKQAVDEALKVLIAKAAQQGVDKIVIPPAERIAMARGRELKKDKGDRFYRTYVTDLNKSLKELEDNYPVIVHKDVELPYLKESDPDVGDFEDLDMEAALQAAIDAEDPEAAGDIAELILTDGKRLDADNKGTILDISELVDKYKIEQPRQFAEGGVAMNEQMEMAFMNQGGLKDDGMKRDPVSGNEIPNGSMAKEVRDDISAQLSEGEYVVPADVVRYLGVKHFEDLRDKAKQGLQSMEANGRIGGEPVPVGGPQAAPMMQQPQQMQPPMPQAPTPYSPQPAPPQMAMGGDLSPEEMNEINSIMMAQGGMVPADPYQQQQMQYAQPNMVMGAAEGTDVTSNSFMNPGGGITPGQAITMPTNYSFGFSNEPPGPSLVPRSVTLYGPNGEQEQLVLPAQQARYDELIGQGYTTTNPTDVEGSTGSTPSEFSDDSDDPIMPPATPGAPGTSFTGFKNWGSEVNWADPESVEKFVNQQYNMPDPTLRKGAGMAGLFGAGPLAAVGTIGSLFMAGQVLDTVADLRSAVMIAKAYGNTEGAAIAQAKLDLALKGAPSYVTSMVGDTLAGGTMQFAGHVSGASGLDDLPSNIDEWTKTDFTRFQNATGKKAPVKAAAVVDSSSSSSGSSSNDSSSSSGPSYGYNYKTDDSGQTRTPTITSPGGTAGAGGGMTGSDDRPDDPRGEGQYGGGSSSSSSSGGGSYGDDEADDYDDDSSGVYKGGLMKKKRKK